MFEPTPFHPRRPGLVRPVRVDATGRLGPTRAQARGRHWMRVCHGWYVPSYVDRADPCQRVLEASIRLPAAGAVTGWGALRWMGGLQFDGVSPDGRTLLPVPVATAGFHMRPGPGVLVSEEMCRAREIDVVDGVRVTVPLRSVWFEMRYATGPRSAVCQLDMAAHADLVSRDELAAYLLITPALTGIPQCRRAIPDADENSWSWRESMMRQVWERDAGRPRPWCNTPIFDRHGRLVGTPDLLDPVAGVVGEYDGAVHLVGRRRARDVRREADFRALGLEYVTMLAADWADTSGFTGRLHGAYDRARYEAPARRAWTIDPPAGWTPTHTVAQRRALDPWDRDRLLRHRRPA